MLPRVTHAFRLLALSTAIVAGPAEALELPLPPAGEDIVGRVQVVTARYEDTFADLGDANGLGYQEMVAANPGVDPWLPGAGTQIILPTRFILPPGPREGIVINLAEYRLYYYPKGRDVVYTYPLGIGREGWGSPVNSTTITRKTPNPAWYPPKSIRAEHAAEGEILPAIVPPGPDNPLGPFKFTLGLPGYLIHGSNKQFGIGTRVSHGCFRMFNSDVLALADMVPVGTKVRIIDEPYKFGLSSGRLFLEAHAPLDEKTGEEVGTTADKHSAVINTLLEHADLGSGSRMDWDVVRAVADAEDGLPVEIATAAGGDVAGDAAGLF